MTFEKLLYYGFCFRNGMTNNNLDWNFLVSYKGNLDFKLKSKKNIQFGKIFSHYDIINQGFFAPI
jgi:hypothetical protein